MKTDYKNIYPKLLFNKRIGVSLAIICLSIGCKKFVEVDPPVTSITASTTFDNNSSAASVMTSVYMLAHNSGYLADGAGSLTLLEGLAADELKNYNTTTAKYLQFYQNALSSSTAGASNSYFWAEIYKQIHIANTVIEGIAASKGITSSMKLQLDGEAKFMRAFYHFYAVNIYGDVPLVTTTNYLANNTIARTPKAKVYEQIINDLNDAQNELSDNYVDATGSITTERIRPNKGTAEALLARVYLYNNDWAHAISESNLLINNANYGLLNDLTQVFLKNTKEGIWELAPTSPSVHNTYIAPIFILTGAPGSSAPVAISDRLINSFEANDNRFLKWVGQLTVGGRTYYYPYKYIHYKSADPVSEYFIVFRLAEQYLIRAESEAQLGTSTLPQAIADLNIIRHRAGLPNYSGATDQTSVLNAIYHERQIELFAEWGHRWFDLIRTNNINSIMGSPGNVCQSKGGSWSPNWTLAPLPLSEIQVNPNLTQNPGY